MTHTSPKILIASLGTRGDVQPYVALAKELVARGADVVVTTGEGFDDMIAAAGATSRPVPINYQTLLQDKDVQAALFTFKGKIRAARQNLDLQKHVAWRLWEIGLEEQPDLILFNLKATLMTLVGRRLKVPALPTALQPVTAPTGDFPLPLFGLPDLGRTLNRLTFGAGRFLMKAGLAPLIKPVKAAAEEEYANPAPLIDGHMPDGSTPLSLQGFSRALVPVPEDWPPEAWTCGYWFTEPDETYQPPKPLARFLADGPSPLYLGFGSMPSKDPERLTDNILASLRLTGQRAILASGWGGLTAGELPDGISERVFLLEKAPHSWLFPKCSAVVHHGGAGTTHEAARWGKPSLICPVFGDQPFWGQQIHKIGAGPAPIRQKKITPDLLAAALKSLEQSDYRAGAERAASIMTSEPGASGTADRLMSLVSRQTIG
ncbi:glycosyltransferase [Labrenzia sp. VG12]|uniref:glycosyltransferase n=1 Tax=Labrenzia sp. VG12 TaxID=2021862 RepID=UPI000B8BFA09|nr:glycosyltransferase [Labrenzia sp. VG12]ASP31952.1 UDP-glucose--sterol glucosyltransferase [Labrenzia sp. VG12]